MNYKSQLYAWSVDRVIRMWEATKGAGELHGDLEKPETVIHVPEKRDLATLMVLSEELAERAYVAEEDFTDACKRVVDCLKDMPDALEKVGVLQDELSYIAEQMQGQLSRVKKEAVQ